MKARGRSYVTSREPNTRNGDRSLVGKREEEMSKTKPLEDTAVMSSIDLTSKKSSFSRRHLPLHK